MAIKTLAASAVALAITITSAYATNDAGQDAKEREIIAMHWQPGPVEVPASHSKISSLGFKIVTGTEASRFRELTDAVVPQGVEADAVDFKTGDEIVYQYLGEGYISINDWADVDADAMLTQIKQNEIEGNKLRRERGIDEVHTTRWVERPSLNRDTNTVSWIIEGTQGSSGAKFINAVALKLGRNGFEKITWITDPNSLGASLDGFRTAINSHEFNPGYRYLDHAATDRSAAYGVAGLVAGVLGVKLAKAVGVGAFAALAVFAKKLGFLLILPFAAAGSSVKRLFKRRPTQPVPARRIEPTLET
jgi:uncharacterized membrane-anchored protein